VITTAHPAWDVRIYEREIRSLAKRYPVIYLAPEGGPPPSPLPPNVLYIPLKKYRGRAARVTRLPGIFLKLYRLRRRVAAFHGHDPDTAPILALLRITTRTPCVYDMHEYHAAVLRDRYWLPRPLRRGAARFWALFEKICVLFIDALICASDEIAGFYPRKRAVVLENFPSRFHFPEEPDPKKKRPVILLSGSLTRIRGVEQAVEAFIRADLPPEFRLLLLGWFESEEMKTRVLGRLDGSEKANRYQYIPWVPFEESLNYTKTCSLGLIPYMDCENHRYGIPTKIYEFMASGVPFIYTTIAKYVRTLEPLGPGVPADPMDTDAFARALESLSHDKRRMREMGERGRALFLNRFCWESREPALWDLYKSWLLP
jgi:glycosyltransferase involved in cell wall biosynthesis